MRRKAKGELFHVAREDLQEGGVTEESAEARARWRRMIH